MSICSNSNDYAGKLKRIHLCRHNWNALGNLAVELERSQLCGLNWNSQDSLEKKPNLCLDGLLAQMVWRSTFNRIS